MEERLVPSLLATDFNGDARLDFAVTTARSQDVVTLLRADAGSVDYKDRLDLGGTPITSVAADFTSDGKVDLMTVDADSDELILSIGVGDGSFIPASSLFVGGGVRAMVTGDFNTDGVADLALADHALSDLAVLLGVGDGTFDFPRHFALPGKPTALLSAEITGDGFLDMIVVTTPVDYLSVSLGDGEPEPGTEGNRIFLMQGSPDGGFQVISDAIPAGRGYPSLSLAQQVVGTVERPRPILAVSAPDDGKVLFFGFMGSTINLTGEFNTSINNFAAGATIGAASMRFPVPIALADVTGDSVLDLVAVDPTGNQLKALESVLDGAFQSRLITVGPLVIQAALEYRDSLVVEAFVNSATSARTAVVTLADPVDDSLVQIEFRHPTTQLDVDAFILNPSLSTSEVIDTSTTIASTLLAPRQRKGPTSLVSGSFDPDGTLDVAVVNNDGSFVALGLANGASVDTVGSSALARALTTANSYVVGAGPISIATGDFNGDGVLDLATINRRANNITVLIANTTVVPILTASTSGDVDAILQVQTVADGTFRTRPPIPFTGSAGQLFVTDLNNDGLKDLAFLQPREAVVHYFLGPGDGTFPIEVKGSLDPTLFPAAELRFARLLVLDFDGDEITDLAKVDRLLGELSLYRGQFGGGYAFQTSFDLLGKDVRSLVSGDFNGDGILDLASANLANDDVTIWSGSVGGTFSLGRSFGSNGNGPIALTTGDFNGDSLIDLAVANYFTDDFPRLFNAGDGSYLAETPTPVPTAPVQAATTETNPNNNLITGLPGGGRQGVSGAASSNVGLFLNPATGLGIGQLGGGLIPIVGPPAPQPTSGTAQGEPASGAPRSGESEFFQGLVNVPNLLGDASLLVDRQPLAGLNLAGALLFGGRTVANLSSAQGSTLAPIPTLTTSEANVEAPDRPRGEGEEEAPFTRIMIGLNYDPPRPIRPAPGAKQVQSEPPVAGIRLWLARLGMPLLGLSVWVGFHRVPAKSREDKSRFW